MKRIIIITALALLPLLSACNTMAGVGQDTSAAGKALDNSAEKNKDY